MHEDIPVSKLNEIELIDEAQRLNKIVSDGEATISQVNRLREIRSVLRRIQQARRDFVEPI